jgi:uncharacterized protein (TIGR02231 family)
MLPLLTTLALALPQAPADPVPVAARIDEVTVYGSQALVRRSTELAGRGPWVIEGLPAALDPDSVRVVATGGDVVNVEVRQRLRDESANPRVQALRERLEVLQRELQRADDQIEVARKLVQHLESLLDQEAEVHRREVAQGRPSPEAWQANLDFVIERLGQAKEALREQVWRMADLKEEIQRVEQELGVLRGQAQVPVHDVVIDAVPSGDGPVALVLDTFVHGAGWHPQYDLRTAADLSSTELVYRAKVWQRTGEDWNDVALLLSTAQPQMGAQAPEPALSWVDVFDPKVAQGKFGNRGLGAPSAAQEVASDEFYIGRGEEEASLGLPFAGVQQEGLSVRFRLPRRETVQSRNDPSTVLVGRADLAIEPERYCVPEQVETVWLRAKATNTSEWTLLPGRAAVFFGNDFLGHAQLETVQPNQELTLHLGADPAVTVERTLVEDQVEGPGFLSSRAGKIERWRVHFENHGAVGARADGAVDVIVQEALPRSRDDRVKVELQDARPRPSDDERWKQDRDEKNVYTWIVRVPRGGEVDVTFAQKIEYPKGLEIRERY